MPQLNHKKTMNMPTKVESNYVQDAMKNKSHDPDDFEFQLNSTTARLLSTTLSTSSSLSGTNAESLVDRSMEVVFMPKTIPIDSNSSKTRSAVNGHLASSDDPDRTMTRKYSIVSTKATDGDSKTKKISLTSPNEFLSDLSSSNASSLVDIACALKLQQKDDSGKELDSAKTWKNGETTSLSFDRGKWMSDDPTEIAHEAGLEENQNVNDVVEVFCDEKSCNEGDCGFNGVRDSRTDVERRKVPGCVHYKRRAMFVTPCCNKFYKCRYCHDENEDHHFDRKTLTELICSECDTRQRVQETCEKCCVRFGKYTCLICNLFDDEDKSQYHCYGCGICRIGGRKNFFHCEVCNMCLPIQLKIDGHRCVENISRSNCPVCLGDIHTSRIPCHIPDCGHLLHKMCFDQLLASGHYVCPTCQTSIIDMTKMWEYLDAQAMIMPVPAAYQNRFVNILCNDCHKTSTVRFHFIGLKCFFCGGYNTTQDMKRRRSWALLGDNASSA